MVEFIRYSSVHEQMDVRQISQNHRFKNQELLAAGVCIFENFLLFLKVDIK